MTPELQRLIDIEDIRQLKARFGVLMDALCQPHEPSLLDEFVGLFTEDASIDSAAFGHFEGHEQIGKLFGVAVPSQMKAMWHSFQNPLIEVHGDLASGTWTMIAYVYPVGASSTAPTMTFGRYTDAYRRVRGRWQLAKLFFESSQLDANALSEAAQGMSDAMVVKKTR